MGFVFKRQEGVNNNGLQNNETRVGGLWGLLLITDEKRNCRNLEGKCFSFCVCLCVLVNSF